MKRDEEPESIQSMNSERSRYLRQRLRCSESSSFILATYLPAFLPDFNQGSPREIEVRSSETSFIFSSMRSRYSTEISKTFGANGGSSLLLCRKSSNPY